MSEKSFRVILVLVVIIWAIFVLVPSLTDFLPRAWAAVQYFLPGNNPRVTVTVTDGAGNNVLAGVRVQIVTGQTAYVGETNEAGQAVFESVPAGRALQLRAQKLDYEINIVDNPAIPYRQRARYNIVMVRSFGQRLYVAHETTANSYGFSLLDTASRIVMTPPGAANAWENVPAGDIRVSASNQHMFDLTPNSIIALSTADGAKSGELAMPAPPMTGGLALDANGEVIYTMTREGGTGRSRWLTSMFTRSFVQRFSVQVATTANSVVLILSQDGQRIYVLPVGDQSLMVYDTRSGQRISIFQLGDRIKDAVLARNGQTLYVLTERSAIPLAVSLTGVMKATPVLDKDTQNALAGATRLVVADYQQRHWLCLLQPSAKQVAIIDLDATTIQTVAVGREPASLAHATGTDDLYVADKSGNSLVVVSLTEHKVTDEIDVRSKPALLVPPQ